MTFEERIRSVLLDETVKVCAPGIYTGKEKRFYTFDYRIIPANHGDNLAGHDRYIVWVHYFCPAGENSIRQRRLTRERLEKAGFTRPTEEQVFAGESKSEATEKAKQHYVFECEYAEVIRRGDRYR